MNPISSEIIPYLFAFIVFVVIVFALTGSYSRIEKVPDYLVPKAGSVKIRVPPRDVLAIIEVDQLDKKWIFKQSQHVKSVAARTE